MEHQHLRVTVRKETVRSTAIKHLDRDKDEKIEDFIRRVVKQIKEI
jgi:hypothetical protein